MLKYALVFYSVNIFLFTMECNAEEKKIKKLKYMQAIRKLYSTQKPGKAGKSDESSEDTFTEATVPRHVMKAVSKEDGVRKKKDKMKGNERNKVYPTMFPPSPPKNYTEPMIFPKVYLRFLVSGGFLLNFTDYNRYDNIHDAYLLSGTIYNREINKVREEIPRGEFYKSGGRWVYIRPDFSLRRGDILTGTMWYQYCIYEDDWMNFLYDNYTEKIRIDVDQDNQTMKIVAKYYF